jgi:hypothetical protein
MNVKIKKEKQNMSILVKMHSPFYYYYSQLKRNPKTTAAVGFAFLTVIMALVWSLRK